MCNYAAKVRLFFDIYNNYKLFCKNSLKSLCMCIFFCTFARCIVMGRYAVDADFIINDNGCQLKLSINVNSRIDFVFAQKNAAHCIGEQNKKKRYR